MSATKIDFGCASLPRSPNTFYSWNKGDLLLWQGVNEEKGEKGQERKGDGEKRKGEERRR